MARQWSARCYGVARPREGSRQNSIGGSGVLSLRHSGLVLYPLIPWRVGAEELPRRNLEIWFRPARCCSTGSGRRRDLDLMISGPRVNLSSPLGAREARQWSARCYGVARPREGSRQNSSGARACFLHSGSARGCRRICRGEIWKTRRLLTNRPCSSLVYEESDSKERLRVSNWIVQRLYNYAVKKTVEL